MKRLKPFSYFEPSTLREAMEILAEKSADALPLAGGTDLLPRMKRGDIRPSQVVNLKRVKGLDQITQITMGPGGEIIIGALATLSSVEHSPLVRSTHPVLSQAVGLLGSPSIRNLGTLGGNVGRASPAADSVPSLIVLGAEVEVEGLQGKKRIKIEDIFSGPGRTILAPGEVITAVRLPKPTPRTGAAYLKLGRRAGVDCALVGVAVLLKLSEKDNEVEEARVALASVSPVPLRAKRVEQALVSGPLTMEPAREAARLTADTACPLTDMRATAHYRKEMAEVLAYRAILEAFQRAQGGEVEN